MNLMAANGTTGSKLNAHHGRTSPLVVYALAKLSESSQHGNRVSS